MRTDFRLPGMPSSHGWWWHPGAPPAEKNSLTLHVIAVREYEADDPIYCDALSGAAYAFKNV